MTDERALAAGCLMVGLPGPELEPETAERLRELEPGGVILFARNLESPEQTAALLASLAALPRPPRLVALDQEGGAVSRLEPWIGPTPSAAELARRGRDAVTRFAALTGRALMTLGFNIDFAPVVDLSPPDAPNGIGDRSFSEDPQAVLEMAGGYLDALQGAGVAGCLKHFPGLGPTAVDSHVELPTAARGRDELERADLVPFRELGSRAAAVMVGHGHYPAYNPGPPRPATGSATLVRGLLRERLGFGGLVATDDLLMGAVKDLDVDGSFAVESLAAGCDLLLYCTELDRAQAALDALVAESATNAHIRRRLADANAAVRRLAEAYPARPAALDGWTAARREIADFVAST